MKPAEQAQQRPPKMREFFPAWPRRAQAVIRSFGAILMEGFLSLPNNPNLDDNRRDNALSFQRWTLEHADPVTPQARLVIAGLEAQLHKDI